MNTISITTYCLVIYFICCARVVESDSCAVNFHGASSARLSAESTKLASIGNYSVDYTQHTFDIWMSPNQFVGDEQSVFQTGQVYSSKGAGWAVEFKIKTTIWQKGETKPSSSVLYVDVWTLSSEAHAWSKARHYIILAEDSFPWLHVVFSAGQSDSISINGKNRRLDQYGTSQSDVKPQEHLAIGGQFKGSVADVRVWNVPSSSQSLDCASEAGANMLMYFPLNECQGETFTGYFNGAPVCAMMYGSYDMNAIWIGTSPDVSSCASNNTDVCVGATHVIAPATPNKSSNSQMWLPSFNNLGYKAMVTLPIVFFGVLLILRRNRIQAAHGELLGV